MCGISFPYMPDYQARLNAYTEGKDPLVMQQEAPAILLELIDGVNETELQKRPAPEKWSVGEILAHLAEDELATSWRYRQIIEHCGCDLASFDQDQWAHLGDYTSWNPKEALELFRLLRMANLRMLGRLSADEWQKFGVHAERGKITVSDLARHMAGHDMNHIDQIQRILCRP